MKHPFGHRPTRPAELAAPAAKPEECAGARQQIQDECFIGRPDPGHEQQIKDMKTGAATCRTIIVIVVDEGTTSGDGEATLDADANALAHEIEAAFASVSAPGTDDPLVRYPNHFENDEILAAFRGKHWRDIPFAIVSEYRFSLVAFSSAAYRF